MKRALTIALEGIALGILAVAVWFALSIVVSEAAPPVEAQPYCHANSGASGYVYLNNPAWVQHLENNGTPKAGHELDFFTFEGDTDCDGAFPTVTPTFTPTPTVTPTTVLTTEVPSATPTDAPTDTSVPTDEPTSTPTQEVTDVPTATPTDTPGSPTPTEEPTATPSESGDPTDEASPTPDVTPTELGDPTPTPGGEEPTPTITPKECRQDPCGWLWHLVGPNGQTAWFASYSLRPGMDPNVGKSWYPPSAASQLRCLGWVSVSNLPGRPLSAADAQALASCMGGQCVPVGR